MIETNKSKNRNVLAPNFLSSKNAMKVIKLNEQRWNSPFGQL